MILNAYDSILVHNYIISYTERVQINNEFNDILELIQKGEKNYEAVSGDYMIIKELIVTIFQFNYICLKKS